MKHNENDSELPGNPVSTDNGNRTGTQHVERNDDWLEELEYEMEEMAKKWPGSGQAY
ncbi:hypothetical protein [Pantoea sp. R102]|uniref:hypothetical protein n=1 Tax=Pantoea sp. R102 TaxID=2507583 RepID=UPI0014570074|nr:hypothetical protein [Pantoea sp. R102]